MDNKQVAQASAEAVDELERRLTAGWILREALFELGHKYGVHLLTAHNGGYMIGVLDTRPGHEGTRLRDRESRHRTYAEAVKAFIGVIEAHILEARGDE